MSCSFKVFVNYDIYKFNLFKDYTGVFVSSMQVFNILLVILNQLGPTLWLRVIKIMLHWLV